MKLRLEITLDDSGTQQSVAHTVASALMRYAQGIAHIGCVPAMAPLWRPEGGRPIGCAWVDPKHEETADISQQGEG
jgi:hypothetical protein